ncbi:MAG: hypothetical protein U0169_22990 [Polyangiaceae bacterium]
MTHVFDATSHRYPATQCPSFAQSVRHCRASAQAKGEHGFLRDEVSPTPQAPAPLQDAANDSTPSWHVASAHWTSVPTKPSHVDADFVPSHTRCSQVALPRLHGLRSPCGVEIAEHRPSAPGTSHASH